MHELKKASGLSVDHLGEVFVIKEQLNQIATKIISQLTLYGIKPWQVERYLLLDLCLVDGI